MKISHMQLFIHGLTNPKKLGAYRILSMASNAICILMIALMTAFHSDNLSMVERMKFWLRRNRTIRKEVQWIVYPIRPFIRLNTSIYYKK